MEIFITRYLPQWDGVPNDKTVSHQRIHAQRRPWTAHSRGIVYFYKHVCWSYRVGP